jgi:voltage-gated potassium channel
VLGRFLLPVSILGVILVIGTIGYLIIGNGNTSFVDSLYMTVITVATIGYSEIIDLSGNPGGRIFTMFIAFTGIGVLAYIMSSFTAFIVEGELTRAFRRHKMEHQAQVITGHYIVCGLGLVGTNIISELRATGRQCVVIDTSSGQMDVPHTANDAIMLQGDASDNDTLKKAGILAAAGLFAVTSDDNLNLVICLTAKQLNNNCRVVSCCNDLKNTDKLHRAGADAVVSPNYIGGLRMASEMVRPTVVTFLDTMLRDPNSSLRVEEIAVPVSFAGNSIKELGLQRFHDTLLLAIANSKGWKYNPEETRSLAIGDKLIFMTTVTDRAAINEYFQKST